MIRKMLVIAAAAVIPMTGLAGAVAIDAGIANAAALVPAAITCAISGAVTFGDGITAAATLSANKTSTSATDLTGTGTGCQTTVLHTNIVQASTKCSSLKLGDAIVSGNALSAGGVAAATHQFPGCTGYNSATTKANEKLYAADSAWGFVGGVQVACKVPTSCPAVDGVAPVTADPTVTPPVVGVTGSPAIYAGYAASSTTGGILAALKHGVSYTDSGVAITLLVSTVDSVLPGGDCGAMAGFVLGGTVKKATSHLWTLKLCLDSDSGAGTTNVYAPVGDATYPQGSGFLRDLTLEAAHSSTGWFVDGINVATANVASTSVLHIS